MSRFRVAEVRLATVPMRRLWPRTAFAGRNGPDAPGLQEELNAVAEILRDFPRREQDIISLKFDAELSNTQIAQIMDVTEANVRVILFRTLRKMREIMVARPQG